jgi:hypothetical protein
MNGNIYFIVEPYGGSNFVVEENNIVVNISIEDPAFTNRLGVIKYLPNNYKGDIEIGDMLIVHHNVFRTYYDYLGNKKESFNHIKDNMFFVGREFIYMVIKKDGTKVAFENNVFVKPIYESYSIFEDETEVEHIGTLYLSNEELEKEGFYKGDGVMFAKDSEYEFMIEGERLYRMTTKKILAKA